MSIDPKLFQIAIRPDRTRLEGLERRLPLIASFFQTRAAGRAPRGRIAFDSARQVCVERAFQWVRHRNLSPFATWIFEVPRDSLLYRQTRWLAIESRESKPSLEHDSIDLQASPMADHISGCRSGPAGGRVPIVPGQRASAIPSRCNCFATVLRPPINAATKGVGR